MSVATPDSKRPRGKLAPAGNSPSNPRYEDVPVGLLLPPLIPAREAFDDVKFQELCESITLFRRILQPLVLEREGAYFRIHAGHRRSEAAKAVGLVTVPAMVWDAGTCSGEAVKSHENGIREDLNPAEEAVYFVRLLEGQCGNDVDKLCDLVKQKRGYVEKRLLLKLGCPMVFEALQAGLISIGVAEEFNKVVSVAYRRQYLQVAAQGGCSIRQARDWANAANNMPAQTFDPGAAMAAPSEPPPVPVNTNPRCMFCQGQEDQYEMQVLFAHASCMKAAERQGGGGQ